jgi:hypothetical protein
MTQRILFFFPHCPYPPRSGAHKRCLQILSGFKDLNCKVTLISSNWTSETPWTNSSIEVLNDKWVSDVLVYEASWLDYRTCSLFHRYYQIRNKKPPLSSPINAPQGFCRWVEQQLTKIQPDVLFMNYAYWDRLFYRNKFSGSHKIIDTHDLVTLNSAMQNSIRVHLPNSITGTETIYSQILEQDFFNKLNLEASEEEFSIYEHYNHTIVISSKEVELVKSKTSKTKVSYIPVLQPAYHIANQYNGPAIYTTGPNLFNTQGYLYFVKLVLPLIFKKDTSFLLQVTGACCEHIYPTNGVQLLGYVPDIVVTYNTSRFAICPVLGGTGQQIKIVEAMAYGLPVVATCFSGERSPIIHKQNGFIAKNAEEFADYVLQLWGDRDLCMKLGSNARETISSNFSQDRLVNELSLIIN